jgi:hypothetical protein
MKFGEENRKILVFKEERDKMRKETMNKGEDKAMLAESVPVALRAMAAIERREEQRGAWKKGRLTERKITLLVVEKQHEQTKEIAKEA